MPAKLLVATPQWQAPVALHTSTELITVSDDELQKLSFMRAPQQVMAVFPKISQQGDVLKDCVETNELTLMLDGVQDPGNLGTIIRIADWFGIEDILCSHDTVDCWNPKVVQATMGSIARIKLHYTDLIKMVDDLP